MQRQGDPPGASGSRLTRRQLLARAGRLGLGASGVAAAAELAACASSAGRTRATPTVAPKEAATPTPDTRPLTLAITGDIMLGRSVNDHMLATDTLFPFSQTADVLRGFDLTVGNLECVVSRLGTPQPKQYTFEADPRGFERLVGAGFDIVSLANNHSGDYGKDAFVDMLTALPGHGITPVGGGRTLAEAHQPVIVSRHGTTVGFLSFCEIEPQSFAATDSTPGHAWLTPEAIQQGVAATRPRVDFLIVFTHWGIEYQPVETDHQQAMARLAIDAGADLVVGAHPHVIQPFEMYKGKPLVYSLGNFVFDEMFTDDVRTGHVLTLTVQRNALLDWKLRTSYIGDYGEPHWLD